jgi:hypothetical protein
MGPTGPTGPIFLPNGINYSDYIFWDGSKWAVGDSTVHIGGFAGQVNQQNYTDLVFDDFTESKKSLHSVSEELM